MESKITSLADNDTIVAIATPPGRGGIGIVRLSGEEAFRIGHALFAPANPHAETLSHQLVFGHAIVPSTAEHIDETLAAFMVPPHTYTREPVVEIQAHGGPLILKRIVAEALALGARAARPGEMTLRAFLNGRLDLTRAEAVMSLINAETDAGRRLAMRQLEGQLGQRVSAARDRIIAALRDIEASIDFPEQDVPEPHREDLAHTLADAHGILATLLATAHQGRLIRDGARVVIAGRPNVGKSSLLNALLGHERAIVTDIAGTTRDTVEEAAAIDGVPIHLVDTAGLTDSEDPVERMGIERSRAAARGADLLVFVVDAASPLTRSDRAAAQSLRDLYGDHQPPVVMALNKADLPAGLTAEDAQKLWPLAPQVSISCVTGSGLEDLRRELATFLQTGERAEGEVLVSSVRQQHALETASDHLGDALAALGQELPIDLISIDLRGALDAIGEVTGETANVDLLDKIFAEFCIGK